MCRFRGFYLCDVVGLLLRGKEATRKRMEEIAKQPGHITPRAALNQLQVLSIIYTDHKISKKTCSRFQGLTSVDQ